MPAETELHAEVSLGQICGQSNDNSNNIDAVLKQPKAQEDKNSKP